MFRNKVGSSHQARTPTGTGMPFALRGSNVLFSKVPRRVLWFTQPPVCGHRAASPVVYEANLSVPRLKCLQLCLHLAMRVLALCLIIRVYLYCFPNFLNLFLWKISRPLISSTCHVVLRSTSLLSCALDGRPATVVVRRRGYTSL